MNLFKNIIPYKLTNTSMFALTDEELEKKLSSQCYTPCEPTEKTKVGWEKLELFNQQCFYKANNYIFLLFKKEDKILPAEVIKSETEERINSLEEKEGRKLKKVEKQTIKDDVIISLLPRAFSKYSTVPILVDLNQDMIYVDTGSVNSAEDVLGLLRQSLESLPVIPYSFEKDLSIEMKEILLNNIHLNEEDFILLDEFEISDGESTISCKKTLYQNEEIQNLVNQDNNYITKLALDFVDNFSFVLTHDNLIKRLKISADLKEVAKQDKAELEDKKAKFDADFVIFSQAFTQLFRKLENQFGKMPQSS